MTSSTSEAARALGEQVIADGGSTTAERLTFPLQKRGCRELSWGRRNPVAERPAFEKQIQLFKANPDSARKATHVGESQPRNVAPPVETAAWTMIANLILNTDEVINRN